MDLKTLFEFLAEKLEFSKMMSATPRPPDRPDYWIADVAAYEQIRRLLFFETPLIPSAVEELIRVLEGMDLNPQSVLYGALAEALGTIKPENIPVAIPAQKYFNIKCPECLSWAPGFVVDISTIPPGRKPLTLCECRRCKGRGVLVVTDFHDPFQKPDEAWKLGEVEVVRVVVDRKAEAVKP